MKLLTVINNTQCLIINICLSLKDDSGGRGSGQQNSTGINTDALSALSAHISVYFSPWSSPVI